MRRLLCAAVGLMIAAAAQALAEPVADRAVAAAKSGSGWSRRRGTASAFVRLVVEGNEQRRGISSFNRRSDGPIVVSDLINEICRSSEAANAMDQPYRMVYRRSIDGPRL